MTISETRHAYRLGLTFEVERLEEEREAIASQLAYMIALERGEALERAQNGRLMRAPAR